MNSFITLITFSFTVYVSYSWTSMGGGGMSGVTYASGTIYNVGTMCPNNANQGYVCDGRNFGDKHLSSGKLSAFCSGHPGTSRQYGFGHGVTSSQKCGECAQIRVPRLDGKYNYMNVMMVDHFTWSMEVGTTEIAYLAQGTRWVVGDRLDFDFRIVDDYDCYGSFDGSSTPSGGGSNTPSPTTTTTASPVSSGGGGNSGSSDCSVSTNWGAMKVSPYWGSTTSGMYAVVTNPPVSITSFEVRGANQNDNQFQSCVKQNLNSYQCDISGGALREPASVRINGVYYGYNIIVSMTGSTAQYPLSSCGTSGGSPGTTPTTPPRTPPPVQSGGGGGNGCLVTMNSGSSNWWASVTVSDCGVDVERVYIKGNGRLSWTEGAYKSWSGGYYVFSTNGPYVGPLSFKVTAKTGQTITSNNILADTTPNRSGRMDSSFSSGYTTENDVEDNGLEWTVLFAIIVCCLVCIGCIIGGICWWKAKGKRGKAYFKESTGTKHGTDEMIGNNELDADEIIVEAEMIDVDGQNDDDGQEMITATNQ